MKSVLSDSIFPPNWTLTSRDRSGMSVCQTELTAMSNHQILFSPIKEKRTFERVSSKIKGLILAGTLQPGDKLPSEIELAQQFSVSRQTIREALRILELSGFITVQKGGKGGPVIRDTILSTIGNLFLDAFQMEKISLDELTSARLDMERVVLHRAMDQADEQDLSLLRENVAAARKKIENQAVAVEENIEFHNLLARASKNHLFVIILGSITAATRDLLSRLTLGTEEGARSLACDEGTVKSANAVRHHEQILDAMAQGNGIQAIRLMEEHLLELDTRLRALIINHDSRALSSRKSFSGFGEKLWGRRSVRVMTETQKEGSSFEP
jgi:GntR family transcriptional repressor for pyruvate dehydrogenase complex